MITAVSFIAGAVIGVIGTLEWVGKQLEKNYPDLYEHLRNDETLPAGPLR